MPENQNQMQNQAKDMLQGVNDQFEKTMGHVTDGVEAKEAATWALGGSAGLLVGSLLGPVGAVAGAVGGAVLADRWAEGASAEEDRTAAAQANPSPGAPLQQIADQCDQVKQQMVATMNQIPEPEKRTVYQMAINAVNSCAIECRTAAGQFGQGQQS